MVREDDVMTYEAKIANDEYDIRSYINKMPIVHEKVEFAIRSPKKIEKDVKDKKNLTYDDLVDIQNMMNGKSYIDTTKKAEDLERLVTRRIEEEKEKGENINYVVINNDGIETGNSKKDKENEDDLEH